MKAFHLISAANLSEHRYQLLQSAGDDVYVYGVSAYSTLGWFDDPILNTFVDGPAYATAGLIFHELAHQKVYVQGDADFNEAFAMTVENQGVLLWLASHGDARQREAYRLGQRRHEDFLALVAGTRERLLELYRQPLPPAEKRRAKAAILADLRRDYAALKASWGGYRGYDRWFAGKLNNARFVSVQTYRRLLPAFTRLFHEQGDNWPAFYRAVERLAKLPAQARRQQLDTLLARAAGSSGG